MPKRSYFQPNKIRAQSNNISEHEFEEQEISQPPVKKRNIYGIDDGKIIEGRSWLETFGLLINRYGDETSVHALNHICQRRTGFKERIFWGFGFLIALYCFAGLYSILSERFRRKQFQTTVNETFYPVYELLFPEVVICNSNRLNWARLNESMELNLLPEHRTPEFKAFFIDIVSRYDRLTVNSMYKFQDLEEEYLKKLNYINFTNVVDFMSWRCDEILTDCKFCSENYNCCDIFFTRRTKLGQCLSFNSLISEGGLKQKEVDNLWPWSCGQYGRGNGLKFRALLNVKLHSPYNNQSKGILLMTVDHGSFTESLYTPIRASNVAYISTWGTLQFADSILRSVSSDVRGCVFEDEINSNDYKSLYGLDYEQENCVYECQQVQMVNSCNCTLDLFFPPGPYPICKLIDIPCVAKNWEKFRYFEPNNEYLKSADNKNEAFPCQCSFNCYSLLLYNYVYIEPLRPEKLLEVNDSFVDVDFYWRQDFILTYRTSLVFSWLDLLVSFGGVASLLLGCSFISIIEVIIFLFLKTPYFIWNKRQSNKRLKNLKEKQSIQNLLDYDSKH